VNVGFLAVSFTTVTIEGLKLSMSHMRGDVESDPRSSLPFQLAWHLSPSLLTTTRTHQAINHATSSI